MVLFYGKRFGLFSKRILNVEEQLIAIGLFFLMSIRVLQELKLKAAAAEKVIIALLKNNIK